MKRFLDRLQNALLKKGDGSPEVYLVHVLVVMSLDLLIQQSRAEYDGIVAPLCNHQCAFEQFRISRNECLDRLCDDHAAAGSRGR